MLERLERLILRTLRVPPKPHPPEGSPGSLRLFRAAPAYLRYLQLGWLGRQLAIIVGFLFAASLTERVFGEGNWTADDFVAAVEGQSDAPAAVVAALRGIHELAVRFFLEGGLDALLVAFLVLQAPFTFAMVGLAYRYRWYMTTDRSLRIREGIWNVREQTMTFSNIQNVSIRQGPLQRLFGIADLEVRSAGGGSKPGQGGKPDSDDHNLHLARFTGVANAAEIRDAIRAHLDRPPLPAAAPRKTTALQASRELVAEARELRRAFERQA